MKTRSAFCVSRPASPAARYALRATRSSLGASIIEIMIVVAILCVIGVAIVLFFTSNGPFLQRTKVRQQVMQESRMCMDLITDRLRNGKARSLILTKPAAAPPGVQYSRVDFVLQSPLPSGATAYAILLENNTVYTEEFGPGVAFAKKPIASNVSTLNFFPPDSQDPGILEITLRIDAPWDASNDGTHVSTLLLPNNIVHMVESP